jgi:hypothetical protein
VRQRAGVFESNIIYFFKASTFERQWLEQARRVASLGKPFKGSNRRANTSPSLQEETDRLIQYAINDA